MYPTAVDLQGCTLEPQAPIDSENVFERSLSEENSETLIVKCFRPMDG
jgi:hypothetical protein